MLNDAEREDKENKKISTIDYIWWYTNYSIFPEEWFNDLQEKAIRVAAERGIDILFMKDNEEWDDYITKHFLIINPYSIVSEDEVKLIFKSLFS